MTEKISIPAGYRMDAKMRLIPESQIPAYEMMRDELVRGVHERAGPIHQALTDFRMHTIEQVDAFMDIAYQEYGRSIFGSPMNRVTLTSYDGTLQVQIEISELVRFDERIAVAQALIDEYIQGETKGLSPEIRKLIDMAFRPNKAGRINMGHMLSLRSLDIQHEKWQEAMRAIADSITVYTSRRYIRLYKRDDHGKYERVPMDLMATLKAPDTEACPDDVDPETGEVIEK